MTSLVGLTLLVVGILFGLGFIVQIAKHGTIILERRASEERTKPYVLVIVGASLLAMILGGFYLLTPASTVCRGVFLP